MIVFKESNSDTNVIHIVIGPETEFQFDISGHIVLYLDDKLDKNKKNFLYFNKCMTSEEELSSMYQYFNKKIIDQIDTEISKNEKQNKNKTNKEDTNKNVKNDENFTEMLRCPKCLAWGTHVNNGIVTMCKTCQIIENGKKIITPMTRNEKKILDSLGLTDETHSNGEDTKNGNQ